MGSIRAQEKKWLLPRNYAPSSLSVAMWFIRLELSLREVSSRSTATAASSRSTMPTSSESSLTCRVRDEMEAALDPDVSRRLFSRFSIWKIKESNE